MVNKISQNEFAQVKNEKIALVDFSAKWCGPCNMLAPVLEEVSEELSGQVAFYNIDVDDNPDIASEYGIMSIPALILFKNGEKVAMHVGFQPEDGIKAFINSQI